MRAVLALAVVALICAAPVDAKRKPPPKRPGGTASQVLVDCARDGDLDAVYRTGVLRLALRHMPKDVRAYSDCADVLRAAIAAGRTVYVKHSRVRLKVRCTGKRYAVKVTRNGTTLAAGPVPACRRGTRVVSLSGLVPATLRRAARKHRTARVKLTPGSMVLSFVVELRPFRR